MNNNEYETYFQNQSIKTLKSQQRKTSDIEDIENFIGLKIHQIILIILSSIAIVGIYSFFYNYFKIDILFSLIFTSLVLFTFGIILFILIILATPLIALITVFCEDAVISRANKLPLTQEEFDNMPYKTDENFASFFSYCFEAKFFNKSWYVESVKDKAITMMTMYLKNTGHIPNDREENKISYNELKHLNLSPDLIKYLTGDTVYVISLSD